MGKAPIYDTLYENSWVELIEVKWPERGVDSYTYLHERKCRGKIICVLPFRQTDDALEFLLRVEICPAWEFKKVPHSITGCYEGFDPEECAVRELKEEAGYTVDTDALIKMGTCRGTKADDTIFYLYGVDLTDVEQGEATGDGSKLEEYGHTMWTQNPLEKTNDPFVFVLWAKLLPQFTKEGKMVIV